MKYRKLKGYKYELLRAVYYPIQIDGAIENTLLEVKTKYLRIKNNKLTILAHYAWDGPSGPTIDTKTFMLGSLIHDALYQMMREGHISKGFRLYADQLLRKICIDSGMNRFRAWYVYHSVRAFAGNSVKARKNPRGQIVEV